MDGDGRVIGESVMTSEVLVNSLFVFMLAGFVGFQVIKRVSPLLHTPLMSLTNALDGIAVVGAILLAGRHESSFSFWLGMIAIVAATSNIVGGFLITNRMLNMFKTAAPRKP
jgi:H+-translocating NAD(P) transhydrogenase subunit alpha